MPQDQMLLSGYRCLKAECYREIFQSLATFASMVVLSRTGLSWTYKSNEVTNEDIDPQGEINATGYAIDIRCDL
jgi:hypothetical protein